MNPTEPLEEWRDDWRGDEPPPLTDLRRHVRRAALRDRLTMLLELAVGSAGMAAGAWLVHAGAWLIGIAAAAFGAFGLLASFAVRSRSPQADIDTVSGALATAVDQTRRQHRAALGGLWVCVAALLFLAAVALARTFDAQASRDALLGFARLHAAGCVFVAAALAISVAALLRASRRLAHLTRLREEL